MDPLSDVLSLQKPRAYVTGCLSAGNPWSLQLPAYTGIKCYAVVTGECWLSVAGVEQPVRLRAGNCLLLPHGRPFVIASDLALSPMDARTIIASVERYQGVLAVTPGDDFFLLGSHFALEGDARFLLDVLPPIVMLKDEVQQDSIRWAVERMLREMRDFQPGGTLVAQQVAYTLLVEALRLHSADDGRDTRPRCRPAFFPEARARSSNSGLGRGNSALVHVFACAVRIRDFTNLICTNK